MPTKTQARGTNNSSSSRRPAPKPAKKAPKPSSASKTPNSPKKSGGFRASRELRESRQKPELGWQKERRLRDRYSDVMGALDNVDRGTSSSTPGLPSDLRAHKRDGHTFYTSKSDKDFGAHRYTEGKRKGDLKVMTDRRQGEGEIWEIMGAASGPSHYYKREMSEDGTRRETETYELYGNRGQTSTEVPTTNVQYIMNGLANFMNTPGGPGAGGVRATDQVNTRWIPDEAKDNWMSPAKDPFVDF